MHQSYSVLTLQNTRKVGSQGLITLNYPTRLDEPVGKLAHPLYVGICTHMFTIHQEAAIISIWL